MQSGRFKNNTWKTRDGRIISITEMTDQHLRNTIKYIETHQAVPWMKDKLQAMKDEAERRIKNGIMVRPQNREDILIFGDE